MVPAIGPDAFVVSIGCGRWLQTPVRKGGNKPGQREWKPRSKSHRTRASLFAPRLKFLTRSISLPGKRCRSKGWFNPENFQIYVDEAPEAVLQVTPGHRDIFLDRAQASTRKLARAYEDMKTMVAQVEAPDRIVITNQDTFACLGKSL